MNQNNYTELIENLDKKYPDRVWLKVLEILSVVGVADQKQLQTYSGMSRDRNRRVLGEIRKLGQTMKLNLIKELNSRARRPGSKGRTPIIWRLEKNGASLLRQLGYKQARDSKLNKDTELLHALCILDLIQNARENSLHVKPEHRMSYGDQQWIRPDVLISYENGQKAFFEVEQLGYANILRRIVDSLVNKIHFFKQKNDGEYQPIIRMIFNLERGKDLNRTIHYWQEALRVAMEREELSELPFSIYAMPLLEFLEVPDWKVEPEKTRWKQLKPNPLETEKMKTTTDEKSLTKQEDNQIEELPFTTREEALILKSLLHLIQVEESDIKHTWKLGDPEFFNICMIIYSASHGPDVDIHTRASVPWGSLYLLREYLRLNPRLKKMLNDQIRRSAGATRWNTSIITHRMQTIIDTFLYYHGWKSKGPMTVYATPVDWNEPAPRSFQVVVNISEPELLLGSQSGIIASKEVAQLTEEAISWVLWAVFAYPRELGVKPVPFW